MATKYIVNNVSGQTINGQQLQPYKVYTALLTQSGGDDLQYISEGLLTVGVTYELLDEPFNGWDFTNVGAPNNVPGTKFVATGVTPNNWGTQTIGNNTLAYNTGAPVVTVLENTIGNVWFTYNSIGTYEILTNGLLTVNKTAFFISNIIPDASSPFIIEGRTYDNASLYISSFSPDGLGHIITDDVLLNTPIEIRVYN